MNVSQRLRIVIITLFLTWFIGTIGYHYIEGFDFLDSAYFTLITITTIGYGEIHTLSPVGRVFTMFIILTGLGTTLYALSVFGQLLLEGQLYQIYRKRKLERMVSKMKNHIIVCGFGRLGAVICSGLAQSKSPFVVIELNKENIPNIQECGYKYIEGDATLDSTLLEAGIDKARALVTALQNDAQNLFTTISAKQLNSNLFILARYEHESTSIKLLRAGASKTLNPFSIGANRAVQILERPNVTDFVEQAMSTSSLELAIEEIQLRSNSNLINKPLKDTKIKETYGTMIIGIKRKNGDMVFNPSFDTVIEENDMLIAIGPLSRIRDMSEKEGIIL